MDILKVLEQKQSGLDDLSLARALGSNVSDQQRVQALNMLIQKSRVQVLQRADGTPFFKHLTEEQALKLKDLTADEQMVYQAIEDSNNLGIWITEIKAILAKQGAGSTNSAKITTILKKLERKGLIKTVNSIQGKNKKVWMAMDIEPSAEVTGGLCGAEDFDIDRIEAIVGRIEYYVRKQGRVSLLELQVFVKQLGILPPQVKDADIQQIVQSMVYDRKLESCEVTNESGVVNTTSTTGGGASAIQTATATGSGKMFKPGNWTYGDNPLAFTQTPCAFCTLKRECAPGNRINPQNCVYMKDWCSVSKQIVDF